MFKRLAAYILLAATAFSLCGCGGMFDKEYSYVSEYSPSTPAANSQLDKVSAKTYSQMKKAILDSVLDGDSESTIVFDAAYEGDINADLASACWEIRTQDALCAYYVENISYEVQKIVTYHEATISVSYSDVMDSAQDVIQMQYSTGIEQVLRDAMDEGKTKIVVLISRSLYSAENMERIASAAYKASPAIAPREPTVKVNMFSGSGRQRLYEINISYGVSTLELQWRKNQLDKVLPFAELEISELSEAERVLLACRYLAEGCVYENDASLNYIYAALCVGRANSEGMALAYVELCRQLGIECSLVYGQRNWQEHCWCIVEIDGANYHVDPAICQSAGFEGSFLLSDEAMWGVYRWDTANYPVCKGELSYADVRDMA